MPARCCASQDDGSAGDVDLRGRQIKRVRDSAAGVMEQMAKCPRCAVRFVSGLKKGRAFLKIEEKASVLLVK